MCGFACVRVFIIVAARAVCMQNCVKSSLFRCGTLRRAPETREEAGELYLVNTDVRLVSVAIVIDKN